MLFKISESIEIDTDIERLPIIEIFNYLKTSYWAQNRTYETVEKSIQHSLNFGLYLDNRLIGFARVVTDYAVIAYLCDVFILPDYQAKGYGVMLINQVQRHPELSSLRRWLLATKDAHDFYRMFGYTELDNPTRWMNIFRPDL